MKKILFYLLPLFLLAGFKSQAQQLTISDVHYTPDSSALIVKYNISASGSADPHEAYQISMQVLDSSSNRKYSVKNGPNGKPQYERAGTGKEFVWNYKKEGAVLSRHLGIVLHFDRVKVYGGIKYALTTFMVPGLGNYFVFNPKYNPGVLIGGRPASALSEEDFTINRFRIRTTGNIMMPSSRMIWTITSTKPRMITTGIIVL
jgi:hypothetical protein